jgi:hypothetical protein
MKKTDCWGIMTECFLYVIAVKQGDSILKMETICSSETSDLAVTTRRHILEDIVLYYYLRESIKSYIDV